MTNKIVTLQETITLIKEKKQLIIAGDEKLLDQLPDGNWIGGSIPYLLGKKGAKYTEKKLHVKDLTNLGLEFNLKTYDENTIHKIATDGYENGIIFNIIPAMSAVHAKFSEIAPNIENQYINPLLGWVSGCKIEEIAPNKGKTYLGKNKTTDKAVALFIKLPENKVGRIEIINAYSQGKGDEITFPKDGFANTTCIVNGKEQDLYEYLESINFNWTLPLVADYAGAKINVGLIKDEANKIAMFFAPVFTDTVYKIAEDKEIDYQKEFRKQLEKDKDAKIEYAFSCLYNYFNFNLEGKPLDGFTGTFTFGEIAYQLLNVTFVYLVIEARD